MADYTNILHGDLDDAAAITVLSGMENLGDYVEYGLTVNGDYSTSPGTISISEGKFYVLVATQNAPGVGHEKHRCLLVGHLDARSGRSLATTGQNYVWAKTNVEPNSKPEIRITDTDAAPSDDSLKIAEVNTDTQTEIPYNRNPNGAFEDLTSDDLSISNTITWPDGETTDTHPLTFGEPIDNRNNRYDTDASDPPGVVERASSAAQADSAETATNADNATQADNAAELEGYTADELLQEATNYTASEWEPLLDSPYEWTDINTSVDWRYRVDNPYDRYRVSLQVDNYNNWIDALYLQVNGVTADRYRFIDIEAAEYLDTPEERANEVRYQTRDSWIIGDVMARAQSMHTFYVSCPTPVLDEGNGPGRQYPVYSSGEHQTGTIRTYHLTGNLTQSMRAIDELRIFSDHEGTAMRAQIYGQNGV